MPAGLKAPPEELDGNVPHQSEICGDNNCTRGTPPQRFLHLVALELPTQERRAARSLSAAACPSEVQSPSGRSSSGRGNHKVSNAVAEVGL